MDSADETVFIFTDGACRGNPGPGGWGVLLRYRDRETELFGFDPDTTNNRMELTAAIRGLEALKRPCKVILSSDSIYLLRGITEWLPNWIRKGWKTAGNTPVKNCDLWQRLTKARDLHQVDWQWVKGHSGHPENERADRLANHAIDEHMLARRNNTHAANRS